MFHLLFIALLDFKKLTHVFFHSITTEQKSMYKDRYLLLSGITAFTIVFFSIFVAFLYYIQSIYVLEIQYIKLIEIFGAFLGWFMLWVSSLYFFGHLFCQRLRKYYLSPVKFLSFLMNHLWPIIFFQPITIFFIYITDFPEWFFLLMIIFFIMFLRRVHYSLKTLWKKKSSTIWFLISGTFFLSLLPFQI